MAAQALTNVQLLVGSTEAGPFSGEYSCAVETQMKEANNFAALGYRVVIPGLTSATFELKGWADFATTGISNVFNATKIGSQQAVGVIPFGSAAAAGDAATLMRGRVAKTTNVGGNVGDVASFELMINSDYADVDGMVGAPLVNRATPTFTGTAFQLGAVSASKSLFVAQFVTAAAGTNLVTSVTSDNAVGFPSPAAVVTLSTVSAVGWQVSVIPGPITDDWFKVASTIASSTFTYAVLLGIG